MKKNITSQLITIAAVAVLNFGTATRAQADGMTVKEAITKALSYDPTIRKVYADVTQADGFAKGTRADLRPQLLLEGGAGPAMRNRPQGGNSSSGDVLFSSNASLVARQLIWSNGYFTNRYKDAKERLEAKLMLEREQREITAFAVVEAFLSVTVARNQIVYAQMNFDEHNTVLKLSKDRAAAAGNQADVELAEARNNLAQNLMRERRLAIQQAEARFERLVGEKPPAKLLMPKVPHISAFEEIDPRQNWHYKAVQKQLAAAELEKKSIRSKYAPRVYLEGRGSAGNNVDSIHGRDNAASVMVTASWNLLDGGSRKAEIQQAQADIDRQEAILEETLITIRSDAYARWEDYKTLSERINILTNYQSNLQKTVKLYREQFDLGTRPLLSILDIQNEATSALIRIADERRNYAEVGYRLLFFGGKLIPYTAGADYIETPLMPDGSPLSNRAGAPPATTTQRTVGSK